MNIKEIVPTVPEVVREAFIVGGGLLLAALVFSQFPTLKKFVKENLT